MEYNISNYPWGNYRISAKKYNIQVNSNAVGVNLMEITNETYTLKTEASSVSSYILNILLNLKFTAFLHVQNLSPGGVMNIYADDSQTILATKSISGIYSTEKEGYTYEIDSDITLMGGANGYVKRYLRVEVRSNSGASGEFTIDLSTLPQSEKYVWKLRFSQATNGGEVTISATDNKYPAKFLGVRVSVEQADGSYSTQNIPWNGAPTSVISDTVGLSANTKILFVGALTEVPAMVVGDVPSYIVIEVEPSPTYSYVNMTTPTLSYNSEESNLEWDEVVGAEEYEVYRNNVKIATVLPDGEVKTS